MMAYYVSQSIIPVGETFGFPGDGNSPHLSNGQRMNQRDYLDRVLQPGRHATQAFGNSSFAAAQSLDAYFNEMRINMAVSGSISLPAQYDPNYIETGDFNGDGIDDLVTLYTAPTSVQVRLGNGAGGFSAPTQVNLPQLITGTMHLLTTGDFNGDGRDDVAFPSNPSNAVVVLLASADGSLGAPVSIAVPGPLHTVAGDVNGDGKVDLLVSGVGATLRTLLGRGDGTFETIVSTSTAFSSWTQDLKLADVDGDGKLDALATNDDEKLVLYRGNGDGTFAVPALFAGNGRWANIGLLDLDGDGDLDVALGTNAAPQLVTLTNDGSGAFVNRTVTPVADKPQSVRVHDIDQDGQLDLVLGIRSGARGYRVTPNGLVEAYLGGSVKSYDAVSINVDGDAANELVLLAPLVDALKIIDLAPDKPQDNRVIIQGNVAQPGDAGWYSFTAAAGQTFYLDIDSAEFQYSLDARLELYDAAGNKLAESSAALDRDSGLWSVDPFLVQQFATAGTYYVRVSGEQGTVGDYRLKITPDEAVEKAGPRVLGALPGQSAVVNGTRQIVILVDDQLDPATLTAENFVVVGAASGVRSGQIVFDPFESTLVWTADEQLPVDNYTVTLKSGANGITDLHGNRLDGETPVGFAFPRISGNGIAGGDFTYAFRVAAADATPALLQFSSSQRTNYKRDEFIVQYDGDLSLASVAATQFIAREAGIDGEFDTADDRLVPLDTLQDKLAASTIRLYTRGTVEAGRYRVEGNFFDAAGFPIALRQEFVLGAGPDVGTSPAVIGTSIAPQSANLAGTVDSINVDFSASIDPATLTAANVQLWRSPDTDFFDGNDVQVSAGSIQWDPLQRRATLDFGESLASGFYRLTIDGQAGGVASPDGTLLDGEFLNSYLAGNQSIWHWQNGPSGDGIAGGDYVTTFSVTSQIYATNTTVAENSPAAVVGQLSVIAADASGVYEFSVSDPRFVVVNGELQLRPTIALDAESEPTVSLVVTAKSDTGPDYTESLVLQVTNIDEPPTAFTFNNATVAENASGAWVSALTAIDPDGGANVWTVSDVRFDASGGQLRLKPGVQLDFEAEATVTLTVTATSGVGLGYAQTFVLQVVNVDEAAIAIALGNSTVVESSPGASVGTLTVIDPDGGANVWTVSDARFDAAGGYLRLKAGIQLDFELEQTATVIVAATSSAGLAYAETFVLQIVNANETPSSITLGSATVAENTPSATVGTLAAVDPDFGDAHTWTVSDARFEVSGGQLRLKPGVQLDFETEPTVTLSITARDLGGLTRTQPFVIQVQDTTEPFGHIVATVVSGQLRLTGSAQADDVLIELGVPALNSVRVTPRNQTTLNGLTTPQVFAGITVGIAADFAGGDDRVAVRGTAAKGAYSFNGGAGNDTYDLAYKATVLLVDSAGSDTITFASSTDAVKLDLALTTKQTIATGAYLQLTGAVETLVGGPLADTLRGNTENNWIQGGAGKDTIYGAAGFDRIFGGADGDTLYGDAGDDSLFGEAGDDKLLGGDGNDYLGIDPTNAADVGAGNDSMDGGAGNDTLIEGLGRDTLIGGLGDDYLFSGADNDSLNSGDGNDRLYGDDGNDTMYGGKGNDFLSGGDGNDILKGEANHDILIGDLGIDQLSGGDNDDILIGGRLKVSPGDGSSAVTSSRRMNDAYDRALAALLAAWGAAGSAGRAMLQTSGVTSAQGDRAILDLASVLSNDGSTDTLAGDNHVDWLIWQKSGGVKNDLLRTFTANESSEDNGAD